MLLLTPNSSYTPVKIKSESFEYSRTRVRITLNLRHPSHLYDVARRFNGKNHKTPIPYGVSIPLKQTLFMKLIFFHNTKTQNYLPP